MANVLDDYDIEGDRDGSDYLNMSIFVFGVGGGAGYFFACLIVRHKDGMGKSI